MAISTTVSRIGVQDNLPDNSTYDLLLVKTDGDYPVGQLTFQFDTTPRKITGIQKVAQLFLKNLMTQRGSDVLHPTLGTDFPNLCIGANRVTLNDTEFAADVATTIKDAEGQTVNMTASLYKDTASQLKNVVIQNLVANGDALAIILQIVTVAGEVASISAPFPQLDLKLSS